MNNTRLNLIHLAVAGTIVLLATGCQQHDAPVVNHADDFKPETEVKYTQALEATQKAAGARADATLYADHFDGTELSSLGTDKLDLMVADSHSDNPLVVYLAIPDDSLIQDRRLAVGHYLEDHGGLKTEQIKFVMGPNPDSLNPAAPNLTNYPKTDTAASQH